MEHWFIGNFLNSVSKYMIPYVWEEIWNVFLSQLRSLFMVACETEVLRAIWDLYLLEADPFLVFFLILVMVINGRWAVLGFSYVSYCEWRSVEMGNSRKYPYTTTDGFHVLTPSCLWKFQSAFPTPCPQNSIIVNPPSPSEFLFFFKYIFDLATALCFLVLFWCLQSKIAQIQTVKIFQSVLFVSVYKNSWVSPSCN